MKTTAKQQVVHLNNLRMAPRKVRAVVDLVRGLHVNEAEAQLLAMRRRPAGAILKLLRSAVVNAEANKKLSGDKLYIESVWVDGGPMLKRFLPRARGMATAIQKKSSHVTLVLIEKDSGSKRFTIVKPKKTKAVEPTDSKKSDAKNKIETEGVVKTKDKPGFFRRSFQRKSV